MYDPSTYHVLKVRTITTLCLLEKVFPPSFFDLITHFVVHLIDELDICGPIHCLLDVSHWTCHEGLERVCPKHVQAVREHGRGTHFLWDPKPLHIIHVKFHYNHKVCMDSIEEDGVAEIQQNHYMFFNMRCKNKRNVYINVHHIKHVTISYKRNYKHWSFQTKSDKWWKIDTLIKTYDQIQLIMINESY
jgi:hypothetical protein